ncbi:MAG TPA: hypothetical protein EYN27_12935 [Rhodospirillales bacterium]|nr:hypothetical protein [Rhodospirillales bacterium]
MMKVGDLVRWAHDGDIGIVTYTAPYLAEPGYVTHVTIQWNHAEEGPVPVGHPMLEIINESR